MTLVLDRVGELTVVLVVPLVVEDRVEDLTVVLVIAKTARLGERNDLIQNGSQNISAFSAMFATVQ